MAKETVLENEFYKTKVVMLINRKNEIDRVRIEQFDKISSELKIIWLTGKDYKAMKSFE